MSDLPHTRVEHWRCSCGAFGHSNSWDANAAIKARHVMAGHSVESWERGRRSDTLTVSVGAMRKGRVMGYGRKSQ